MTKLTRRELLATTAATALVSGFSRANGKRNPSTAKSMINVPFERRKKVRLGIIGSGSRGTRMMSEYLTVGSFEIKAICDNVPANAEEGRAIVEKAGQPAPELYTNGDYAFEKLCAHDDLDFIYVATPWEWHAPMGLAAMKAGKHVGIEVPMATSLTDIWKLVETSEKTRRHCLMLENCCFNYNELLVLNMVRAGIFGELTHGEGAYLHDLRRILNEARSEGLWRRTWHTKLNGNIYPTHGLGPVANYMNINRGDRFDYLVSVSSNSRSLDAHREKNIAKTDQKWNEKYICGDINTSVIKTANGLTIMLQHDVSTPRPYDRINHIQGTKGVFRDYPARLFLDGQEGHRFTDLEKFKAKYEHQLWTRLASKAESAGHGGMDYIMVWRLAQYFRDGLVPDFDVYDGASWSAPMPLSVESMAKGSMPIKFPDFTRGHWSEHRDNFILGESETRT